MSEILRVYCFNKMSEILNTNLIKNLIFSNMEVHNKIKNFIFVHIRPVARRGSGGSADPPLRTKGPLFGTSRVKLLRPITING